MTAPAGETPAPHEVAFSEKSLCGAAVPAAKRVDVHVIGREFRGVESKGPPTSPEGEEDGRLSDLLTPFGRRDAPSPASGRRPTAKPHHHFGLGHGSPLTVGSGDPSIRTGSSLGMICNGLVVRFLLCHNEIVLCRYLRVIVSVDTKFSVPLGPVGWVRCGGRRIPSSTARWLSKSCPSRSPRMNPASKDSTAKPRPWPR